MQPKFERATSRIVGPITTEGILAGLWTIKNDDLGGLTHPLTFNEGRPPEPKVCWWNIAVRGGRWLTPAGYKRNCD
ncbi:MAG: hypothetical protein ACRDHO_12195 [Actinomycetota bacterium]